MKTLIFSVAAAAILLPAAANAEMDRYYRDTMPQRSYQEGRETTSYKRETYIRPLEKMSYERKAQEQQEVFNLADGSNNRILLKGEAIYLLEPNGNRFLAPNGHYITTTGTTYFSEDGVVLRTAMTSEEQSLRNQLEATR